MLKSSSCYPLVNFTRPFCQNLGITLPNYVYQTPDYQNNRNDEANMDFDRLGKLDALKISHFFKVDISTVRKCAQALPIWYCHLYFASCDRTQSVFKEQNICHESYLDLTHVCGKLWEIFVRYYIIQFPEAKKLLRGELQPTRNAGDSPECWYFNGLANSAGNVIVNSYFRLTKDSSHFTPSSKTNSSALVVFCNQTWVIWRQSEAFLVYGVLGRAYTIPLVSQPAFII
jgi:hypothetical protein